MTPNFALNLSEDGITLLHRAARGAGWVEVGSVALDAADLGGGLSALRDTAQALEGPKFATKLILPPSQLLYASIAVDGDLKGEVERTLEERTPYEAAQLSYDVSGSAPEVQVVAVARETLTEAEDFIGPYGFNTVGFTAIPDPDHFEGEPNLGGMPSKGGTGFTPDAEPVKIITAQQADAAIAASEAEIAKAQAEKAKIEHAQAAQKAAEDDARAADAKAADEAKAEEPGPAPIPDLPPIPEPPTPEPAAFSSRRRPSLGPATDSGDMVSSRAPRIAIPVDEQRSTPTAKKPPKVEPRIKTGEAAKPKPTPPLVPPPVVEPAPSAPSTAKKARSGFAKSVAGLRAKSARKAKAKAPPKPGTNAGANAQSAAKPDPIAELAARQAAGKPRFLGLILTAVLLIALLLFAALSSYLLPEGTVSRLLGREAAPTEVVQAPLEDNPAEQLVHLPEEEDFPVFTIPSPEEIAEAEVPEPEILAPPVMSTSDAQTAYAVSGIWQLSPDLQPAVVEQNLDALYESSLDPDLAFEDAPALAYVDPAAPTLSIEPPTTPPAAVVMFNLDSRGLVRPSPEGSLNPGSIYVFAGTPPVAALPRPDGLVPQLQDNTALPDTGDGADTGATPEVATDATEDTPQADPRLAGFKPRQRPADLQEQFERATQGGLSNSELAGIRPLVRPESAQAKAREEAIAKALAEAAADDAAEQARATAEAAAQAEVDKGTAQAVARSQRPNSRPRNFGTLVARAKQAAPQGRNPAAAASTAQPSRGSGPAVARASRAKPTGTTRATVARAATDNNAIALGKVALVGVFGTSSNRRALVRMPNGRFKKLAVGDRVDGGRVAAIGDGQLKYKKGSRTVTLEMPKG